MHEVHESSSIGIWLYCRYLGSILTLEVDLQSPFHLLTLVPRLQIVNDCQMVERVVLWIGNGVADEH